MLYSLCAPYRTSYHWCTPQLFSSYNYEDFSAVWRKSLRKMWRRSDRTQYCIILSVSQCFPVCYEICGSFLNFIPSCISGGSVIIRFVALNGFTHGRIYSAIDRNVACCTKWQLAAKISDDEGQLRLGVKKRRAEGCHLICVYVRDILFDLMQFMHVQRPTHTHPLALVCVYFSSLIVMCGFYPWCMGFMCACCK